VGFPFVQKKKKKCIQKDSLQDLEQAASRLATMVVKSGTFFIESSNMYAVIIFMIDNLYYLL